MTSKTKTSHLTLIHSNKLCDQPLGDHDINLNRIDALINSIFEYQDDENDYNFLLSEALISFIKAKQMYVAWIEEEY